MVHLTYACLKKSKSIKHFIDNIRVYARGGAGGQGIPSLGGKGGNGGNVYVVGNPSVNLKDILIQHPQKRFIANNGINSRKTALYGKHGKDVIVEVPFGVTVRNDNNVILGEINTVDDKVMIASGTKGGNKFNNFMSKRAYPNEVRLDLKLIAELGLVGFPNAGKSTLLSSLSSVKPKIASYPFTTITPQLGTINYKDGRTITIADLPGLINKAHLNVGMGHNFLKHVERTQVLLFVVDLNGFRLKTGEKRISAVETILMLIKELEMYRSNLMDKSAILVLNKMDIECDRDFLHDTIEKCHNLYDHLELLPLENRPTKLLKFHKIHAISAKYNKGTNELKDILRECLDIKHDQLIIESQLKESQSEIQTSEYNTSRLL